MSRRVLPIVVLVALAGAALWFFALRDTGLSVAEYRAQAKTICAEGDRATADIGLPQRATPDALVDYFERVLAANDRSTRRFRALDPPEELRDAHSDALRVNDEVASEVRRVVRELEADADLQTVFTEAQGRLRELARESGDAAGRLGVAECADS
jgi:hypothetical protein